VSSLEGKVIVFDGVCLLCSRSVAFVLAHDRQNQFRFATLQSATGKALLIRHGLDPEDPDSFLLADGAAGYANSDAIIRVVTALGGAWRLAAVFRVVPRLLRDRFYRWIARNRYRWFGRRAACVVPSPEMQGRFLE
jgi:predicted DCC family thiol-disulfide oxidoreductase YuxK